MNYNKFSLKILAFLVAAQCGMVQSMENPLGRNIPIDNPMTVKKDAQKKEEEKLSPEEQAAIDQEINNIQGKLDDILKETDTINIQGVLDEINIGQEDENKKNIRTPNAFIPGLEHFMPGIDKATRSFEKEQERLKYQNTILLGHPKCPVALYKRDFMELPFFAADIAIAYLFFQYIKSKRVDYIYSLLTEDTKTYIELLTQIKELQKSQESPNANKEEISLKSVELFKQLAEKHSYIGNNPFKLEVVIPFLSAILGYKLSRYAQEQCIVKGSFAPEAQCAYTQDKDGNYNRFEMEGFFATPTLDDWQNNVNNASSSLNQQKPNEYFANVIKLECTFFHSFYFPGNAPLSTITALRCGGLDHPNSNPIADQIPDVKEQLNTFGALIAKGFYKLAGVPDWVYDARNSRAARFAMEIAVLATITTQIDGMYNATWLEYVEKNVDTLLSLLHSYEAVKHLADDHTEKQSVHNDLLAFIQTGNTCVSWKDAGRKFFSHTEMVRLGILQKTVAWTTTIIASSLLWKSRSLIKYVYMAAKNNLLPTEAWLAGGFVTAYISILTASITIPAAVHVYQDICWIKDKVKDTIKSFFTKKDDGQKQEEKEANTSSVESHESNTPKEAIA